MCIFNLSDVVLRAVNASWYTKESRKKQLELRSTIMANIHHAIILPQLLAHMFVMCPEAGDTSWSSLRYFSSPICRTHVDEKLTHGVLFIISYFCVDLGVMLLLMEELDRTQN